MKENADLTPSIEKPEPMQGTFTAEDLKANSAAWGKYKTQTSAETRAREAKDAERLKQIEDELAAGVHPTSEMLSEYLSTPRTPEQDQELKRLQYLRDKSKTAELIPPKETKKKGNWISRIFSRE